MQFWAENPRCLFSSLDVLPNSSMTTEEKLNALTRLVILISILIYVFKNKYSWVALIAGIAGIMFLYYMFVKKQKHEGFYTEYPSPDGEQHTNIIHTDFPIAPVVPVAPFDHMHTPFDHMHTPFAQTHQALIAPIYESQIVQGVSSDFPMPQVAEIPQAYYNPSYYQVAPTHLPDQMIAPLQVPQAPQVLETQAYQQVPTYDNGYDFKKLTPVGDHLHSLASFHTSQLNIQANHLQTKAIEGIIKHRNRFASQQNSAWGGVNIPTQV